MEHLWSQAGATGGNRSQMEWPENGSNKPIGNRWQPTATVPERMVKVDHLPAKEGVTFLAPQSEVESREPEGPPDSSQR